MKLETPNCPCCGQPAVTVMESQLLHVEICISGDDGKAEYTGRSEDAWAREQELDDDGRAFVHCDDGHMWATYIDD